VNKSKVERQNLTTRMSMYWLAKLGMVTEGTRRATDKLSHTFSMLFVPDVG
jgi:hypothetical protein